jgi:predicted dehydrogenase
MKTLRFALLGTGFWSRFQLAGWNETGGVECVALYNRTRAKAEQLAAEFDSPRVYDDPCELVRHEEIDFVDVVTNAETHHDLVCLAAQHGIPVICQKPMAPSLEESRRMVKTCADAGVPFFIHENWRWQAPIRALWQVLRSGEIGEPYRARLRMTSAFPVFDNQPFLRRLEQFLLVDIGSHILDVVRFLFGEPTTIYCRTQQIQTGISGEDLATVMLGIEDGGTVVCELGYPSTPMTPDHFPQTFIYVEGTKGSAELAPEYWLSITTKSGTRRVHCPPPRYQWADPMYDVVHASIVPCHADLLAGLRGERLPETHAADNLRTMQLVYAAYDSAESGDVVRL